MGNQLTRLHVDFMSELPKVGEGEGIVFGRVLGGGRFLKTLQCWHEGQMVVVKAFSKTSEQNVTQSLREATERLEAIRDKLEKIQHPNVLPFTWFPETQRAAFIVRPYINTSLKERLTARPFLTAIEKKWLTYQLLTALVQCHEAGLFHGDVKSNNVLVTSWNWLVLADFTSLKPTYLPEDNPGDLSYFFDDDYERRYVIFLYYRSSCEVA
jgi:phosphoinositide-3-kinase, regulatory subunit 4